MRKIFNLFIIGALVVSASSCKKYLDINDNPNTPTTNTPDLVLPQALVSTAFLTTTYNNTGAWQAGYQANAGGFGAFGVVWTYNYSTGDNNGLWTSVYDNANDYQYIINNTSISDVTVNFNAVARIMKSYIFLKLVDQYGNVPYSEALKGASNVTPKYDKDADVYKALYDDLTVAIGGIDANVVGAKPIATSGTNTVDVLFGTNSFFPTSSFSNALEMAKWRAFANTLRLKILVKCKGTVNDAWATGKTLTGAFLTDDAIVNPGFGAISGKANTWFTNFAWTVTGGAGGLGQQQLPTPFALSFYNGVKITDNTRGKLMYQGFPSVKKNQLGVDAEPIDRAPTGSAWFTGTSTGQNATSTGIMKGINAGMPLMLAAESYFIQAEAAVVGVGGVSAANAQNLFDLGIEKSFVYLAEGPTNAPGTNGTTDRTAYQTANPGNALVNFPTAGTVEQKKEAIITQKWIALNFVTCDEGFAEFRRTTYPRIVNGSSDGTLSFASTKSVSTRTDKLPVRSVYPSSEYSLNSANVPSVGPFTDRIFWDLN
ncbi:SusD/RagB family nutrient-binding outer membrane lipoprotein [Pedobacter sp. KR3-3]|uniref:SusD/RagB family nutrient-binding outer membrane lipoprotein n=1 Tax=Pedobacter albus TaxID=3113905 RepID=A0ABU7IB64_9SPHI|nr:SusD/RagB family nutrient-binding outer membrane lipoprotein [Pedobacter sp. KR3-3]MEE1946730.1 SusD/RagB family nutrient-binding outer membrane lipoprotein [Pedobacter sp. KR3-3]